MGQLLEFAERSKEEVKNRFWRNLEQCFDTKNYPERLVAKTVFPLLNVPDAAPEDLKRYYQKIAEDAHFFQELGERLLQTRSLVEEIPHTELTKSLYLMSRFFLGGLINLLGN